MTDAVPGTEALHAVNASLIASSTDLQAKIQARRAAQARYDAAVGAAHDAFNQAFSAAELELSGYVDDETKARKTFHANLGAFASLLQDLDDDNGLEVTVIAGPEAPIPGVVIEEETTDEEAPAEAPAPAPVEEAPVAPAPQPEAAVVEPGLGVADGETTAAAAPANDVSTTDAPADTAVTQ